MNDKKWLNLVIVAIALMIILLTTVSKKLTTPSLPSQPLLATSPQSSQAFNWQKVTKVTINAQSYKAADFHRLTSTSEFNHWLSFWQNVFQHRSTSAANSHHPSQKQQYEISWQDEHSTLSARLRVYADHFIVEKPASAQTLKFNNKDLPKLLPPWLLTKPENKP